MSLLPIASKSDSLELFFVVITVITLITIGIEREESIMELTAIYGKKLVNESIVGELCCQRCDEVH